MITILPTIPDTYLVPFHKTGTVMTRDVDGCLRLRFPGHHSRVKLCEQQVPYIKVMLMMNSVFIKTLR